MDGAMIAAKLIRFPGTYDWRGGWLGEGAASSM